MRKKWKLIGLLCLLFMGVLFWAGGVSSAADKASFGGQGNLVMEGENVKFYQQDMEYLQAEIYRLFLECKQEESVE